jgi:hypothetical protein
MENINGYDHEAVLKEARTRDCFIIDAGGQGVILRQDKTNEILQHIQREVVAAFQEQLHNPIDPITVEMLNEDVEIEFRTKLCEPYDPMYFAEGFAEKE